MLSDDFENDVHRKEHPDGHCARGLRIYLALMAFIAITTLILTADYISRHSTSLPSSVIGFQNVAEPALSFSQGPVIPVAQSSIGTAGTFDGSPDFAQIVSGLRGTVVSIGRFRVNGVGTNRAMGGEPGQPAGPRTDGTLEFAAPAAGAVLETVGTGFIVHRDGYILSNYHVVRGSESMVVTVFGQTGAERYAANIVKLDATIDLALLKVESKTPLPEVRLGDSDRTQVADDVIAVGSPFGLDLTVSRGIISAKRKSLVIEGTVHRDLLQTDAAINQGNSGGPLINRRGEIIGVNTAIYTPNGAFAGVGFAVPSNQAKLFLADEIAPQTSQSMAESSIGPWSLSVAAPPGTTAVGAAGPPIVAGAPSPHGDSRDTMECAICHQLLPRPGTQANALRAIPAAGPTMAGPPVVNGTPAPHRDGRENMACTTCHHMTSPRGVSIPGVGGQASWPLANPARSIPAAAPAMAGPPIVAGTLAPHRDGREAMNCATCHAFILATRGAAATPVAQGGLRFARPPASVALNAALTVRTVAAIGEAVILGATVQAVTADVAGSIAQPEGKGVLVSSVAAGSPAALIGLEAGMIIEKVNGRRLLLPSDLTALAAMSKIGDALRLTVSSDRGRQELILTIPAGGVATPSAPTPLPTEFNWRGMEIETFASVTPASTGVGGQSKGAVIAEVSVTSPAQRAGLRANDIVIEINGLPTGNTELLNQALKMTTGARDLPIKISRNNRVFSIVVP